MVNLHPFNLLKLLYRHIETILPWILATHTLMIFVRFAPMSLIMSLWSSWVWHVTRVTRVTCWRMSLYTVRALGSYWALVTLTLLSLSLYTLLQHQCHTVPALGIPSYYQHHHLYHHCLCVLKTCVDSDDVWRPDTDLTLWSPVSSGQWPGDLCTVCTVYMCWSEQCYNIRLQFSVHHINHQWSSDWSACVTVQLSHWSDSDLVILGWCQKDDVFIRGVSQVCSMMRY